MGFNRSRFKGHLIVVSLLAHTMKWIWPSLLIAFTAAYQSDNLVNDINKLQDTLTAIKGMRNRPSRTQHHDPDSIQLKIVAPPKPKPKIVIQAQDGQPDNSQELSNMLSRMLRKLQKKIGEFNKASEGLERKKKEQAAHEKALQLKIAAENIRHKDELKSLQMNLLKVKDAQRQAKLEEEQLERRRLDQNLQY